MKKCTKILSTLLAITLVIVGVGCGQSNQITYSVGGLVSHASIGFETDPLKEWGDTDEYSAENHLTPVWATKNVYNETVSFIGKDDVATLTYTPTKIHKVYDYYRKIEYVNGQDFVVEGNKIRLTDNTKINYWKDGEYYYPTVQAPFTLRTEKGFLKFSEVNANARQISVSYEHNDLYRGAKPVGQEDKFENLNRIIQRGGTINLCAIGDSITDGSGSSAFIIENELKGGANPYDTSFPCYVDLVADFLRTKYSLTVSLSNTAVGGTGVAEGNNQINNFSVTPDLVIVAFGMNDASKKADDYYNAVNGIINNLKSKNPNCEICLVSTMVPNPEVMGKLGNIPSFEEKLLQLTKEHQKVALAPMTSISQSIYNDIGKKFEDINSNHVNHPNDFMHRIYAQTVLTTMLGDGYNA